MTELDQLEQLADLTERLRRRIATSPKLSYTAQRAEELLTALKRPDSPLSLSEKVEALKTTLREYQRGLQFTDLMHQHPGDRKP